MERLLRSGAGQLLAESVLANLQQSNFGKCINRVILLQACVALRYRYSRQRKTEQKFTPHTFLRGADMRFPRKKIAVALAYALGAGSVVGVSTGPFAQTTGTAFTEKVEVTGSHIPTIQGETALPVQVITQEDIQRQGLQTTADLIERLSANSTTGSLTLSSTEGNSASGISSPSLRGLGAQRTLVLLDGKRLSVNGFTGLSVDINSIPIAAVERVEILTDGASAIYGSDAIAGVINLILRTSYQGAEGTLYYGSAQYGGGYQAQYSGTAGYGDLATQKFNAFVTGNYQQYGGLKAAQRSFSSSAYRPDLGIDKTSGNTVPGNVSVPGVGTRNPANPVCAPPFSYPTAPSPHQCRFDYASVIDILPPEQLWNVVGKGTWQWNPDNQIYVSGLYADSKVQSAVSPSPVSEATIFPFTPAQAVLIPPTSPYYPHAFAAQYGIDGQPLNTTWRSLPGGPREEGDESKQSRALVGAKGTLWDWDYDLSFMYNENKATASYIGGWFLGSQLLPLLNSGQINVFTAELPADQVALLDATSFNGQIASSKATNNGVNFSASKDNIWSLPAGPIAMAAGADYYHQTYEFIASAAAASGDIVGNGGTLSSLPEVKRNNWDVYGEWNIPIIKDLEGTAAVRYDHYENNGSTTNPKFSLRWNPVKSVLLRSSYGTGFRAPSLPELYTTPYFGSTGGNYSDPQRCPVTKSSLDCNTQFTDEMGGNVHLKSETSAQWGVGGVFEPVPGNSFGVDYWNVRISNVVGIPGEQSIYGSTGELIPQSVAAGTLIRQPQTAQDIALGIPGRIAYAIVTYENIDKLQVQGVDFTVKARGPTESWGQVTATYVGTYYIKWEQNNVNYAGQSVGGVAVTTAGVGFPGALPRYKSNLAVNWTYGPWQATITQLYIDSYTDDNPCNVPTPPSGVCPRNAGSYTQYDFIGSYTGFKYGPVNATLTFGIKNFLNTSPPATNQSEAFQAGYDPTQVDPRGRFFWGSLKLTYN